MTYQITDKATGDFGGCYDAATPREALDAMGRDCLGYGGFAEWSAATGTHASGLRVVRRERPAVGESYGARAG